MEAGVDGVGEGPGGPFGLGEDVGVDEELVLGDVPDNEDVIAGGEVADVVFVDAHGAHLEEVVVFGEVHAGDGCGVTFFEGGLEFSHGEDDFDGFDVEVF